LKEIKKVEEKHNKASSDLSELEIKLSQTQKAQTDEQEKLKQTM
jgi:hypothetical protein